MRIRMRIRGRGRGRGRGRVRGRVWVRVRVRERVRVRVRGRFRLRGRVIMNQSTLFDGDCPPESEPSEPVGTTTPRSLYRDRSVKIASCYYEPAYIPGGFPWAERQETMRTLAADLAAFEAGELDESTLLRIVRGSLYVLSGAELVRVAKGLVNLMGEK